MRLRTVAIAAAIAATALGGALAGGSAGASSPNIAKSAATCRAAVKAGKPITAKQYKACVRGTIAITTKCSHGPAVLEIGAPTKRNDSVLIRQGHRPVWYTESNLYVSDAIHLCGDPIPAADTPPAAPMTGTQIKSALSH